MLDDAIALVSTNAIPPVVCNKKSVYRLGVTSTKPFTLTAVYGGQLKPKTAWELSLNEGRFIFTMGDIPVEHWEEMKKEWFSYVGTTADNKKIYSLSDFVAWTNANLVAPYALICLILLRDFTKRDDSVSGDEFSRDIAKTLTPDDVMDAVVKAGKMGLNLDLIRRKFPPKLVAAVEDAVKATLPESPVEATVTPETPQEETSTEQPTETPLTEVTNAEQIPPDEAIAQEEIKPEETPQIVEIPNVEPIISEVTPEETKPTDTIEVPTQELVAPNTSKNGRNPAKQ